MDLKTIRQKIDAVESAIIHLLSQRAELIQAAGKLKKDERGARDSESVEQVIERIRKQTLQAGLAPDTAEKFYHAIIQCFVAQELELQTRQARGQHPLSQG